MKATLRWVQKCLDVLKRDPDQQVGDTDGDVLIEEKHDKRLDSEKSEPGLSVVTLEAESASKDDWGMKYNAISQIIRVNVLKRFAD